MTLHLGRTGLGFLLAAAGYLMFTISVFALHNLGVGAGRILGIALIVSTSTGVFLTVSGALLVYENIVITVCSGQRGEDEDLR